MNDQPEDLPASKLTGEVKWFDPVRGFGFVVSNEGGPDILLHANVLRNFGQSTIADGAVVALMVQQSDRGLQATEIISIEPPEQGDTPPLRDMGEFTAEQIAARPILPARVKWFDKAKGFGFANVFNDTADVFLHIEILRRGGMSDLMSGEAIGLRLIDGERGHMAVEIVAWESVTNSD